VSDLAYHFVEAGELKRGLDYARRAAAAAERVYAYEGAVQWYDRARECAEGLEDTAALGDVHERMGRALYEWGRLTDSIAAYERAIALAETPTRRGALRAAMGTAMTHASDPRGPDTMAEALKELDPATQAKERAVALTMIGRFHHYRLEHTRALEYFAEARPIAEAAGDLAALDMAIGFTAGAYQHLVQYPESDRWARADIELGERHGYLPAQASGWEFLAENAFGRGDFDDTVRFAERDLELGRRIGSLSRQAWANFSIGEGYLGLGRVDDAIDLAAREEAITGRLGETRLQVLLLSLLARALAVRGREAEAREAVERSVAISKSIGQPWISSRAVWALGLLEYEAGDSAGACAHLEPAYQSTANSENRLNDIMTGPTLAECYISLGRFDEARILIDRTLELGSESGARVPWASGRLAEARLLAATGDAAGARKGFDEAIATLEDRRAQLWVGRALIARAEILRDTGDAAAAKADLTRARDIAESCHAVPLAARAADLLAKHG
jgi:tetratricopeptide (TPR) repeat protein